jgi:hypothetical protein
VVVVAVWKRSKSLNVGWGECLAAESGRRDRPESAQRRFAAGSSTSGEAS